MTASNNRGVRPRVTSGAVLISLFLLFPGCAGQSGGPAEDIQRGAASGASSPAPIGELPSLESLEEDGAAPQPDEAIDPSDWRLTEADESALANLQLFYSQDNRGELEPCGCPGAPTGGMARRATYVELLREIRPDLLLLEGPSALSSHVLGFETIAGRDRARGAMVLRALSASKPAGFFPGQADFRVIEPAELGRRAQSLGLRLISTNLSRELRAGNYDPYLRWVSQGRQAIFLGLVGSGGSEEQVRLVQRVDVLRSVQAALDDFTEKHGAPDLIVAFTDADGRDLRDWEAAGLKLDILLTPPARKGDERIQRRPGWLQIGSEPLGRALHRLDVILGPSGDVVLESGEAQGAEDESLPLSRYAERVADLERKYIHELVHLRELRRREATGDDPRKSVQGFDGQTRVDPRTDPENVELGLAELKALLGRARERLERVDGRRVALTSWVMESEIPESVEVINLLDDFGERRLARLALEQGQVQQVPEDERYAGRSNCTECHASMDAHWTKTGHAQAWKTLVDRGEERNPDCLPCHTTGFSKSGGFVDPTADRSLLNVQCESCHGPMLAHVQHSERSPTARSRGLLVTEASCRRCHDAANSPGFDFESYAERVRHPGTR